MFFVKKRSGNVSIKSYYILKAVKVVLSLLFFLLLGAFVIDKNMLKSFSIIFLTFYIITIFLESWIFIDVAKNVKEQ